VSDKRTTRRSLGDRLLELLVVVPEKDSFIVEKNRDHATVWANRPATFTDTELGSLTRSLSTRDVLSTNNCTWFVTAARLFAFSCGVPIHIQKDQTTTSHRRLGEGVWGTKMEERESEDRQHQFECFAILLKTVPSDGLNLEESVLHFELTVFLFYSPCITSQGEWGVRISNSSSVGVTIPKNPKRQQVKTVSMH